MATLTGRTIRSTYDQLIQLEDQSFQDGLGTASLSGSYELTGSQHISGTLNITGGLVVNGTASIGYLETTYETSSIIYTSGSTKFGDDTSDTHEITGSLTISGSAFSTNWSGSFTGSFIGLADSASNSTRAVTASQADRATTSSLANKASNLQVVAENSSAAAHYILFGPNTSGESDVNADGSLNYVPNTETLTVTKVIGQLEGTASNADTASVLLGSVISASHCETASLAISTSVVNVTSTSFAAGGSGPFTGSFSSSLPSLLSGSFTGSFTGSLGANTSVVNLSQTGSNIISGSLTITGSSTLAVRVTGSTALTGSLLQSGSTALTGSLLQSGTIALTGSLLQKGNTQISGSTLLSGSLLLTGSSTLALRISGSTALTGSLLQSGSTSLTGSLLQSGTIALTGSLLQKGSTQTTGSNIISGSLLITGSSAIGLRMSGSTALTGSIFQTGSLNVTGSTNISGALTVGTINTGQGATEVYLMNQGVQTGDSVRFNGLGVGTAASGVAGAILATNDIVAFASSDEKLKENLEPIGSATEKVGQLTGYTFDWIPMEGIHVHSGHDVGIIAQEVEKVLPEVVETRENGYKAVKYEKLTALLIQAVNEQQQTIEQLTNRISNLENTL